MKSWVNKKLVNYVLKHLLNAVAIDDIITQDIKKQVFVGGELASTDRVKQWQAEIKAIEGSDIWKCVQASLQYQAQDKIFSRSENFEDVMYGKSMLYNLSLINSILKVISSLQVK